MKKLLKYLRILILILLWPPMLYLAMAVAGSLIPVDRLPSNEPAEVEIYLVSTGLHTDLVLPFENVRTNWHNYLKNEDFPASTGNYKWIGFGWGDLEFYGNTPEWKDLTFSSAINALFGKSPSAIHSRLYSRPSETEDHIRLKISIEQYRMLSEYILQYFKKDATGKFVPVEDLHYNSTDAFYYGKASLYAFKTCNTWVNSGLKYAGLPACLWTPFSEGIFYRYR